MTRAVIYCRSSKDRHDVSIDVQRIDLRRMAEQRGLQIVDEFADVVESGKDEDRPGFQKLYDALRARGRDCDCGENGSATILFWLAVAVSSVSIGWGMVTTFRAVAAAVFP